MGKIFFILLSLLPFRAMDQYEDLDIKMEEAMNLSESGEHLEAYAVLSDIIQRKTILLKRIISGGLSGIGQGTKQEL